MWPRTTSTRSPTSGPTLARLFDRERDRGAVTNAMTMLHLLLLDQIASGRWADAQESARLGPGAGGHPPQRAVQGAVHRLRRACAPRAAGDGRGGPPVRGRGPGVGRAATARACCSGSSTASRCSPPWPRPTTTRPTRRRPGSRPRGSSRRTPTPATDGLLDVVEAAVHAGHLDAARAHADAAVRAPAGRALAAAGRPRPRGAGDDARARPRPMGGTAPRSSTRRSPRSPSSTAGFGSRTACWLRRQRRTTEARAPAHHGRRGLRRARGRPVGRTNAHRSCGPRA